MESLLSTLLLPDLPWADKVAYLAWKFREQGGVKPEDLPVTHTFEPGRYIREFTLPPQFLFVGRVHRKGHIVLLVSGTARLLSPNGYSVHHGPDAMHTIPGYATIVMTETVVVARSIHPNPFESRDIEDLEDEYFEPAEKMLVRGQGVQEQVQKWLAQSQA